MSQKGYLGCNEQCNLNACRSSTTMLSQRCQHEQDLCAEIREVYVRCGAILGSAWQPEPQRLGADDGNVQIP